MRPYMVERAIGRSLNANELRAVEAVESIGDFEVGITLLTLMHEARYNGYAEGAKRMSDDYLKEEAKRYESRVRLISS